MGKRTKSKSKLGSLPKREVPLTDIDEMIADISKIHINRGKRHKKFERKTRKEKKKLAKALKACMSQSDDTDRLISTDPPSTNESCNETAKDDSSGNSRSSYVHGKLKRRMNRKLKQISRSFSKLNLDQPSETSRLEAKMHRDISRREKRRLKRISQRMKQTVCFRCRERGHQMSNCPLLNAEDSHGRFCFTCGSPDHNASVCGAKTEKKYAFAKCFICDEIGHITSRCPKARSIYPNGGCCFKCGSTMHLKSDCSMLSKHDEHKGALCLTIKSSLSSSPDAEVIDEEPPPLKASPLIGPKTIRF